MALPEATFGAIVHKTTAVTHTFAQLESLAWQVDASGGNDFRFKFYPGYFQASSISFSAHAVGARRTALALSSGFVVGATLASGSFADRMRLMSSGSGTGGNFFDTTAYMGFRFKGDTGTSDADGFQYGWAKVKVTKPTGITVKLQIFEWAFDDEGCSIAVGATSGGGGCNTPPVQANLPVELHLLNLLGLGAVGLAALRRRRDKLLVKQG